MTLRRPPHENGDSASTCTPSGEPRDTRSVSTPTSPGKLRPLVPAKIQWSGLLTR
ncbi:hypothetical protein GCM10020001_081250 [Nonomuraea salmonea]